MSQGRYENERKGYINTKLLSTCELNEDPFTYTEEDITTVAPSFKIIDENDNEDVNIQD